MDRQTRLMKRFGKELEALEIDYYTDDSQRISITYPIDEDEICMTWFFDDENSRILFRAERLHDEVSQEDDTDFIRFCNDWNKRKLYPTAVYDEKAGGLHLTHTLPFPERASGDFLFFQFYLFMSDTTKEFFVEAAIKFSWERKVI